MLSDLILNFKKWLFSKKEIPHTVFTDKKVNYFYVDESGSVGNNQKIFIHGCIKTDSPHTIEDTLVKLKEQILDSLFYDEFREKILKEGFHATANNFDMRSDLYKLLPLLDYRAYFVITKKESDFFKKFMQTSDESGFFEYSLRKLIKDRIVANKGEKNIFYFEQIMLKKKSLDKILVDIFNDLDKSNDCEYHIVTKDEQNLAIVDYLNFIFYHLFTENNPMPRMKMNLDLVSPKIATVNYLHNNVFLARQKETRYQVKTQNIIANY